MTQPVTFQWTGGDAFIGAAAGAALGWAVLRKEPSMGLIGGAALGYIAGAGIGGMLAANPGLLGGGSSITLQPGATQTASVPAAGGTLTLQVPSGTILDAGLTPDASTGMQANNSVAGQPTTAVSWSFQTTAAQSPSTVATVIWQDGSGTQQQTTVNVTFT